MFEKTRWPLRAKRVGASITCVSFNYIWFLDLNLMEHLLMNVSKDISLVFEFSVLWILSYTMSIVYLIFKWIAAITLGKLKKYSGECHRRYLPRLWIVIDFKFYSHTQNEFIISKWKPTLPGRLKEISLWLSNFYSCSTVCIFTFYTPL